MSSLTDRTDDVRITEEPLTFEMSEEWRRQWQEFEHFIERMYHFLCYAVPVEVVNYDEFPEPIAKAMKVMTANGATHVLYMSMSSIPDYQKEYGIPVHKMSQVTKLLLTLMRKSDYNWFHEKCKQTIAHYNHLCQFLEDYADKVTMPKLEVPKYDQDKTTPFMTSCVSAVRDWKEARYDSETKITKMLPFRCIVPHPARTPWGRTVRERKILTKEEYEDDETEHLVIFEMFSDDGLMANLHHLKEMFDIQDAWERATVALGAMNARFYPKEDTKK